MAVGAETEVDEPAGEQRGIAERRGAEVLVLDGHGDDLRVRESRSA